MKKVLAVGFVVVLGLAACGSTDTAEVVEGVPEVAASSTPTTESTPESTPESAPESVVPVGSSAVVGDWTVGVVGAEGNANATMQAATEFNDPPSGQYVLVTISGEYGGEGSGDLWIDLDYQFIGSDGVVYDENYEATPADMEDWPTEARSGAVVQYQVVFDVPAGAVSGGTLLVTDWAAWDNAEAEYALGL